MRRFSATLICLFFLLAGSSAFAASEIIRIRYWAGPEQTRVVVDTSAEAVITTDKSPKKLSILFKKFSLSREVPPLNEVNKPGLVKIMAAVAGEDARIELFLADGVESHVFKLQKMEDKPYRVVIDLTVPELEKKESEKRQQIKARITEKDKIIIIDPGHGGEDPGAIGRRKTREKDVVLQIAKRLERDLNSRDGYKAFLTRNGDYYPSFAKRLQIAREYGADVFVSIHADAARNRSARGGSVYCLSTSGASSEAAKILARNENLADMAGGAADEPAGTEESDIIMLNMVQTETINMAKSLGSIVLSNLSDVNRIKFNRIQEAPFRVLKLPHIPSVLVETAYISNPAEELFLRDPVFQKKLAHAIAESIVDFLSSDENGTRPAVMAAINPVKKASAAARAEKTPDARAAAEAEEEDNGEETEAPPSAARETPAPEPEKARAQLRKPVKLAYTVYYVKRGDSLDRIARRHNTTVSEIIRLNNMKARGPLYVNKKLKIPAGEPADLASRKKEKPVERYYKVKRGDKLDKIAIRFNTTSSTLLKLNNMKRTDPLVIGRRLKVSGELSEASAERAPPARAGKAAARKPQIKAEAGDEDEERPAAPPRETAPATIYVVKKGDTLEKIAVRNKTSVPALLKLNNMKKGDRLLWGRQLNIPGNAAVAAEEAPAEPKKEKPASTHYVVRKGDTLDKVALRNNTTITELLKLNNMKKGDPLLAGKRIRIAAETEPEKASPPARKEKNAAKAKKKTRSEYTTYVVKKGDTLEKIAETNNTSLAVLLKINNMKMKDRLLAGKRIRIPNDE